MPLRRKPLGKKAKKLEKEELERLAREAELKRIKDELFAREAEAHKYQRKHDMDRDEYDAEEGFRIRREGELRELDDHKKTISSLSLEMSSLQEKLELERGDTSLQLRQLSMQHEKIKNELDSAKSENYESEQQLILDRERLMDENAKLETQIVKVRAHVSSLQNDNAKLEDTSSREIASLQNDLALLREKTHKSVAELEFRLRHAQREAEKSNTLNESFRDMLAAREADDKKNTTLLELMNQQMDESKKRQQTFLEDERRRTREAEAQVVQLQAKLKSSQEANLLLEQTATAQKRDADSSFKDAKRHNEEAREWMKTAKEELKKIRGSIGDDLNGALQRGAKLSGSVSELNVMWHKEKDQVERLEQLLRKKDREGADRVAFLNAQIASERGIIRDLLEQITNVESQHSAFIEELKQKLSTKEGEIFDISRALLREQEEAKKTRDEELRIRLANDSHFRGRIHDLEVEKKKTEMKLFSSSVSASSSSSSPSPAAATKNTTISVSSTTAAAGGVSQQEYDDAISEVKRLQDLLEKHSIIHSKSQLRQQPSSSSSSSSSAAVVAVTSSSSGESESELARENKTLKNKLQKSLEDSDTQRRISLEVEARLKAQVQNQYDIVDQLNNDMEKKNKQIETVLGEVVALRRQVQQLQESRQKQQQQQLSSPAPTKPSSQNNNNKPKNTTRTTAQHLHDDEEVEFDGEDEL